MTSVFISGSRSIKNLAPEVLGRLDNLISSNLNVIVGDSKGVDTSIQEYFDKNNFKKITVYFVGDGPRNNIAYSATKYVKTNALAGSRSFYTAKDLTMASDADYGLMIWDAKSPGTLSNVIELLRNKKKSVVYVNKERLFKTVKSTSDLEDLLEFMSDHAKMKANEKISLSSLIASLKNEQTDLFNTKRAG